MGLGNQGPKMHSPTSVSKPRIGSNLEPLRTTEKYSAETDFNYFLPRSIAGLGDDESTQIVWIRTLQSFVSCGVPSLSVSEDTCVACMSGV